MPHEYLQQRGIGRRAVVQLVEDGILVRQTQERFAAAGDADAQETDRFPHASPEDGAEQSGLDGIGQDPTPHRAARWWRKVLRRAPAEEEEALPELTANPWSAGAVTAAGASGSPADEDRSGQTLRWETGKASAGSATEGPVPPRGAANEAPKSGMPPISEFYEGPLVEVSGLQRIYTVGDQAVHALRGIDLVVPRRSFALFRGRSGSGKTTLLNLIGSLDTPTAGRVSLFGQDIGAMSADECAQIRQLYIGFVFQAFSLIPTLSAQENVEMTLRILGINAAERRLRAAYCLSLVGLSRWADHRPFEMSGGQQQRLSIARALAHGPAMLIADEPTSDLDSETGRQILQLFARLVKEEGITVLVASHDPASDDFATDLYELQDGRIASRSDNGNSH